MIKVIKFLLVLILFSSCASVKLSDAWKADGFKIKENEKVLVVAKSSDVDNRELYETAIVKQLNKKGVSAIEMYNLFPNFEGVKKPSKGEIQEIIELFKKKNITTVLVTSLKSKITQNNADVTQKNKYIPSENLGKYFFSFGVGSSPNALPKLPPLENEKSDSIDLGEKYTTYVLEAVTYNLLLESNDKLTGVFLVEVIEPKSGEEVLNNFSKIIAKQLEK